MNTSQSNSLQNNSFEELFLDKNTPLGKSPQKNRRKINISAAVISDTKLLQQLDDKADEKEKGKNYEREQNALKKQMLV